MASTFMFAFNAIMPIILLIGLGYLLKKAKFIDIHFVNILNKYIFRVALPVLLFYNVYEISDFSEIKWGVVLFAVTSIMVTYGIGLLVVLVCTKDPRQKGVVLQSIVRSNFALIGVPLAQSLGGAEALAIMAILSAFTIPLANILAVIALTMFQRDESGEKISMKKMAINVFSNPLIIGVSLGLLILFIRGFIPRVDGELVFSIKTNLTFSYNVIKMISQTATPMALIALGGQFEISVVKSLAKQIAIGVSGRILLVPAITLAIAYALESRIPGMEYSYAALIALFGSPVAVSSVIMAHEMGGDDVLAGQLVVWSTILSMITIFIFVVFFRSVGAI